MTIFHLKISKSEKRKIYSKRNKTIRSLANTKLLKILVCNFDSSLQNTMIRTWFLEKTLHLFKARSFRQTRKKTKGSSLWRRGSDPYFLAAYIFQLVWACQVDVLPPRALMLLLVWVSGKNLFVVLLIMTGRALTVNPANPMTLHWASPLRYNWENFLNRINLLEFKEYRWLLYTTLTLFLQSKVLIHPPSSR